MLLLNSTSKELVYNHWCKVENLSNINDRKDIIEPLNNMNDFKWYEAKLEESDLINIYNISSDDWKENGICIPNFKLITSANNVSINGNHLHKNILEKEKIFSTERHKIDDKLFLVATNNIEGPFTLIEGNRRAVALCRLTIAHWFKCIFRHFSLNKIIYLGKT
jgi:hypothetical protein